jgi:hypothetical protein
MTIPAGHFLPQPEGDPRGQPCPLRALRRADIAAPPAVVYRGRVYRFLFSRRWISLVLVALLAIPGCVQAALWQLDRLHARQRQNAQVHTNAAATPRPVAQLTSIGGTVATVDVWRAVTARGRYDHPRQLFVRNRPLDGRGGFYVLTPLVTADGDAVLVNRGWVAGPARPVQPPAAGRPRRGNHGDRPVTPHGDPTNPRAPRRRGHPGRTGCPHRRAAHRSHLAVPRIRRVRAADRAGPARR